MPVLPGTPPLEVHLRRSGQAKRFSLRVSRLDGKVTLTLPKKAAEKTAMRFLRDQEDWLRKTLAQFPQNYCQKPEFGSKIPIEGIFYQITPTSGRSVRIEGSQIFIPGDDAQVGRRISAFLKVLARDRLARASDKYSAMVKRDYTRLTLRDTRSRWGSCSYERALMYSWRLILAPAPVLDYVAAHEVAHLVEMNHSDDFWAVVSAICPDWKQHRAWLRENGQDLHQYRFES